MHYVIGDVHGCYDELITLVNKIENKDKDARFIFVGDWVDRGPKVYDTLLWMHDHISPRGYSNGDEILIHGHTPTASYDYMMNSDMNTHRPGLIGYRPNCINVDGGCCYFKDFPQYLCMLCAICLETLEEIYPYTLNERVIQSGVMECVPVYDKTDKNRKEMENRIC